ncbi:MAG TPA: ATPase domain-containing protein, partial [Methanocella sp.]|nr:ATPase domain-containing protein [Methanocella sp.]
MEPSYNKIPTGISSFDPMIKGGFPAGALVLLLGEVGAGSQEFTYTSVLMLSQMKADGIQLKHGLKLPERVVYISFTKSRENVFNSLATYRIANQADIRRSMTFIDLSGTYFAKSHVPLHWTTDDAVTLKNMGMPQKTKSLIETLIETLEAHAPGNLVIIDSLTDLLRSALTDKA